MVPVTHSFFFKRRLDLIPHFWLKSAQLTVKGCWPGIQGPVRGFGTLWKSFSCVTSLRFVHACISEERVPGACIPPLSQGSAGQCQRLPGPAHPVLACCWTLRVSSLHRAGTEAPAVSVTYPVTRSNSPKSRKGRCGFEEGLAQTQESGESSSRILPGHWTRLLGVTSLGDGESHFTIWFKSLYSCYDLSSKMFP